VQYIVQSIMQNLTEEGKKMSMYTKRKWKWRVSETITDDQALSRCVRPQQRIKITKHIHPVKTTYLSFGEPCDRCVSFPLTLLCVFALGPLLFWGPATHLTMLGCLSSLRSEISRIAVHGTYCYWRNQEGNCIRFLCSCQQWVLEMEGAVVNKNDMHTPSSSLSRRIRLRATTSFVSLFWALYTIP
jgi:hypothetical protein